MKFYDREREFEALERLHGNFRVAVIGRRRVGKTALIENFYNEKCVVFFVPAEKSEKEIILGWASEHAHLHLPAAGNFKDFFDFVFFHLKGKVVFIDELQNFAKVNKSFFYDLQRLVDKHKPRLVVSGSIISAMKGIVEDYKSPLYGRFDYVIKLGELDFRTVCAICRDLGLGFEDALELYSVFGGIPKYYELVEKTRGFEFSSFVRSSFVSYPRPLFEEVKTMLKEEFGSEYKTFFSILSAISQGNNKQSEIASFLGKKQTDVTKYLSLLKEDFEFIERKTPLLGGTGKKGIYELKSNIIQFWFSQIWKHSGLLETLQEGEVEKIVKQNLNAHVARCFEKTVLELVSKKAVLSEYEFERIGRQWGNFKGDAGKNAYEIDFAAINAKTKTVVFGECKWQDKANALEIARTLAQKAKHADWHNDSRTEAYAIFAKSFSQRTQSFEGKKVHCFDLKDLEKSVHARQPR